MLESTQVGPIRGAVDVLRPLVIILTCSGHAPKLYNFWQLFFDTIFKVLWLKICLSPNIAIFGRPQDEIKATVTEVNVIAFTSLIAHRKILGFWKSPASPSFKAWLFNTVFFKT